jgi:hypothetical protein
MSQFCDIERLCSHNIHGENAIYGFNVMVFPSRFLKADMSISAQSIQFALLHCDNCLTNTERKGYYYKILITCTCYISRK